jgi:hypothetical protein
MAPQSLGLLYIKREKTFSQVKGHAEWLKA